MVRARRDRDARLIETWMLMEVRMRSSHNLFLPHPNQVSNMKADGGAQSGHH